MGADQIGYLMVLPAKPNLRAGLRQARKLLKIVKETQAKLQKEGRVIVPVSEVDPELHDLLFYVEEHGGDDPPGYNVERLHEILEDTEIRLTPLQEPCDVATLIPTEFRDTAGRDVKIGGKTWGVSYSGEMSWGDEPTGAGYAAAKFLIASHIYTALGGL